jgi:hypothetical protein
MPFRPLDSGSGIQDQDLGGIKSQDPDPGWKTRIIFLRAEKPFFLLKYLNSLMQIRDGKKFGSRIQDLGWKKFGFGIRDLG